MPLNWRAREMVLLNQMIWFQTEREMYYVYLSEKETERFIADLGTRFICRIIW